MTWWEWLAVSIVGYVVVGFLAGKWAANDEMKLHNDAKEAYETGLITWAAWPLAVAIIGGEFFYKSIIKPALMPKSVKEQLRKDYEERKAEAIAKGKDPESVPKMYEFNYSD